MTANDAADESTIDDADKRIDADATIAEAKADADADAEAEAEAVAEAVAEAKADAEHDADADAGLEADDVVDEGDAVDDGVGHGVSAASDGDVLADDAAEFGSDFYDEFDESELDGPSNMGAPPVSNARKGAVATAFLGAGLALEQIIYGVERTVPAVVQEASEPDPDADLVVHLDKDDPTKSWARMRE